MNDRQPSGITIETMLITKNASRPPATPTAARLRNAQERLPR